jgi:orotate phosphoribosyltransferase
MELIPTQDEVVELLKETGALREGFFQYPNGLYSNQYLQMALAFRKYQHSKILSVALSRKVRTDSEIRAAIPELSIVTPATTGGMPIAFGVCEALRARQVYWAEKVYDDEPARFPQFVTPARGEKVLLVDDILRTGTKLTQLHQLALDHGCEVMGLAIVVYQPNPRTPDLGLPLFYLCKLDSLFCDDKEACPIPEPGQQPVKIWI